MSSARRPMTGAVLVRITGPAPRRHGSVECSNRILRSGLWSVHRGDLRRVNRALDRSLRDRHNARPHHALGLLTPANSRQALHGRLNE